MSISTVRRRSSASASVNPATQRAPRLSAAEYLKLLKGMERAETRIAKLNKKEAIAANKAVMAQRSIEAKAARAALKVEQKATEAAIAKIAKSTFVAAEPVVATGKSEEDMQTVINAVSDIPGQLVGLVNAVWGKDNANLIVPGGWVLTNGSLHKSLDSVGINAKDKIEAIAFIAYTLSIYNSIGTVPDITNLATGEKVSGPLDVEVLGYNNVTFFHSNPDHTPIKTALWLRQVNLNVVKSEGWQDILNKECVEIATAFKLGENGHLTVNEALVIQSLCLVKYAGRPVFIPANCVNELEKVAAVMFKGTEWRTVVYVGDIATPYFGQATKPMLKFVAKMLQQFCGKNNGINAVRITDDAILFENDGVFFKEDGAYDKRGRRFTNTAVFLIGLFERVEKVYLTDSLTNCWLSILHGLHAMAESQSTRSHTGKWFATHVCKTMDSEHESGSVIESDRGIYNSGLTKSLSWNGNVPFRIYGDKIKTLDVNGKPGYVDEHGDYINALPKLWSEASMKQNLLAVKPMALLGLVQIHKGCYPWQDARLLFTRFNNVPRAQQVDYLTTLVKQTTGLPLVEGLQKLFPEVAIAMPTDKDLVNYVIKYGVDLNSTKAAKLTLRVPLFMCNQAQALGPDATTSALKLYKAATEQDGMGDYVSPVHAPSSIIAPYLSFAAGMAILVSSAVGMAFEVTSTFSSTTEFFDIKAIGEPEALLCGEVQKVEDYSTVTYVIDYSTTSQEVNGVQVSGAKVKKDSLIIGFTYQGTMTWVTAPDNCYIQKIEWFTKSFGSDSVLEVVTTYKSIENVQKLRSVQKAMAAPTPLGKGVVYNRLNKGLVEGIATIYPGDTCKYPDLKMQFIDTMCQTLRDNPNFAHEEMFLKINEAIGAPPSTETIGWCETAAVLGVYDELRDWFCSTFGKTLWFHFVDVPNATIKAQHAFIAASAGHKVSTYDGLKKVLNLHGVEVPVESLKDSADIIKDAAEQLTPEEFWKIKQLINIPARKGWAKHEVAELYANCPETEGVIPANAEVYTFEGWDFVDVNGCYLPEGQVYVFYNLRGVDHVWQRTATFAGSEENGPVHVPVKTELCSVRQAGGTTNVMAAVMRSMESGYGTRLADKENAGMMLAESVKNMKRYVSIRNMFNGTGTEQSNTLEFVGKDFKITPEAEELIGHLRDSALNGTLTLKMLVEVIGNRDLNISSGGSLQVINFETLFDLMGEPKDKESIAGTVVGYVSAVLRGAKSMSLQFRLKRIAGAIANLAESEGTYKLPTMGNKGFTAKTIALLGIPIGETWITYAPEDPQSVFSNAKKAFGKLLHRSNQLTVATSRAPLPFPIYQDLKVYTGDNDLRHLSEAPLLHEVKANALRCLNDYTQAIASVAVYVDAGDFDGDGRTCSLVKQGTPVTTIQEIQEMVLERTGKLMTSANQGSYLADHYHPKQVVPVVFNSKKAIKLLVKPELTVEQCGMLLNKTPQELLAMGTQESNKLLQEVKINNYEDQLVVILERSTIAKTSLVGYTHALAVFAETASGIARASKSMTTDLTWDELAPTWLTKTISAPIYEFYEALLGGLNMDLFNLVNMLKGLNANMDDVIKLFDKAGLNTSKAYDCVGATKSLGMFSDMPVKSKGSHKGINELPHTAPNLACVAALIIYRIGRGMFLNGNPRSERQKQDLAFVEWYKNYSVEDRAKFAGESLSLEWLEQWIAIVVPVIDKAARRRSVGISLSLFSSEVGDDFFGMKSTTDDYLTVDNNAPAQDDGSFFSMKSTDVSSIDDEPVKIDAESYFSMKSTDVNQTEDDAPAQDAESFFSLKSTDTEDDEPVKIDHESYFSMKSTDVDSTNKEEEKEVVQFPREIGIY
jgi:hypothetical protein